MSGGNRATPVSKVRVENVNHPGMTSTLDAGMYQAIRGAMLKVLPTHAPGLTYAQLLDLAGAAAARLAELGLQPGDRIVVQLPNGWEFVVLTLACLRAGIVPGSGCATASGSWPGLCTGSPTPTCAPPACSPDGAALTSPGISRPTPRRWPGSPRGLAPARRPRCTETAISEQQRSRPHRPARRGTAPRPRHHRRGPGAGP